MSYYHLLKSVILKYSYREGKVFPRIINGTGQDADSIICNVTIHASFITSEEHLPPLFSTLYHPVNSEKSHSEVLQLAVDYNIGTTTIDKVNRLASITADQSKSKLWFKYMMFKLQG